MVYQFVSNMEEVIFFQKGDVLVTNYRFVNGKDEYLMEKIYSVKIGYIRKLVLLHLIAIFIGLRMEFTRNAETKAFGAAIILIFLYSWSRFKTQYAVRIETEHEKLNCIVSKDLDYVAEIVGAINKAIAMSEADIESESQYDQESEDEML